MKEKIMKILSAIGGFSLIIIGFIIGTSLKKSNSDKENEIDKDLEKKIKELNEHIDKIKNKPVTKDWHKESK